MTILAINLTLVTLIALPIGAIMLVITVLFYVRTKKSLEETLDANRKITSLPLYTTYPDKSRSQFSREIRNLLGIVKKKIRSSKSSQEIVTRTAVAEEALVQNLKTTISQQQKLLNTYLKQVEELESGTREEMRLHNEELEREIAKLHSVIEQKDIEIEDVTFQASASLKMASKIEEVYHEFDELQVKMSALEKQAGRTNALAIELEDMKHSYEQVHRELMRKHEKLEGVMQDNQRMREQMNDLEDKLSEANLQRQQLQKKVVFLQDLNTEMQSLTDANKKLQTELRRVGELESMLNLLAQERDSLLRKKED